MIRCLFCLLVILMMTGCNARKPSELINIAMTPSVDVSHYHSWTFDWDECVDSGNAAVDDHFIRKHLLASVKVVLADRNYVYQEEGPVDFLVSYQITLDRIGDYGEDTARARGILRIRDTNTDRYVWTGEVKRIMTDNTRSENERIQSIYNTVKTLLYYFAKHPTAQS